jgi:prephenate dehydrogenase
MSHKKIGFIGLGLIGGSIAKRLKAIDNDIELIATAGHEETVAEAYNIGLIENDRLLPVDDFCDCDHIFLCTPVMRNIEYLKALKGKIKPGCIITDVGSVKSDIHKAVKALGMEDCFIGGHPMAGSEKTGISNANEHLLENAYYILTPTEGTPSAAIREMKDIVISLGAIPMILDYETHDYATAAISHLPHVIAYSLVNLVKESDDENETLKTIAAGGFKDITRIASSSPVMWENICLENREQLIKLIDAYMKSLVNMRTLIAEGDGDALLRSFQTAKDYRDSLPISSNGLLKNIYELYLDLIDEAGGIATVSNILAANNLNIKNIGIIHNREFEDGVLRIEMYDEKSLEKSVELLTDHGYHIYARR